MAYRLEANENVSTGIRRVILERVDQALNDLTNPDKDRDKGVHDARKNCKRIRAALRLIRGEIGDELYRQENIRIRDAARLIASARDSWVMVETLDKLVADFNEHLTPNTFAGVRRTLLKQYKKVKQLAQESEETIPKVVETLQAARQVENLPILRENFSVFREGLQRNYRQGQRAMINAYAQPTPEMFHEWRKRVKYLWYQIEILVALWPNMLTNLAEELHTLSEYLGIDHDLAVLRRTVLDNPDGFVEEKELLLLVTLIDQKRLALQAAARPLGERIYFDPPQIFTRRINRYWKAWRAEDERQQVKIIHKIQKASPPSMHSVNGWLTTGEIACRLEISPAKVRELIRAGKLPAEKVGNIWIVMAGDASMLSSPAGQETDEVWQPLLGTREAADRLGTSPVVVRKLIHAGDLLATKAGRNWVIKESDIPQSLLT